MKNSVILVLRVLELGYFKGSFIYANVRDREKATELIVLCSNWKEYFWGGKILKNSSH